jgi:hypothetical protein
LAQEAGAITTITHWSGGTPSSENHVEVFAAIHKPTILNVLFIGGHSDIRYNKHVIDFQRCATPNPLVCGSIGRNALSATLDDGLRQRLGPSSECFYR